MKHRLIQSSILVLLVSVSASAEQVIRAQVPFPFHIGVSVMPSVSYRWTVTAASITAGCCDCMGSAETGAKSGFQAPAALLRSAAIF
jgi:hypothetical protein